MAKIKKFGVLTSGGDAPGMNAAIRSVVRTGVFHNMKVAGIIEGYRGLIEGKLIDLDSRSVGHIIQRGGTILYSARSKEFMKKAGRKKAYEQCKKHKIDGLVLIGGDGTFTGGTIFAEEYSIPVIGIPGTIDNDIFGTDYTIGYDTALNTVVESVDKIRDTASAHNRLFLIEVMGRDAGFIALRGGIAVGAEAILLPEEEEFEKHLDVYLTRRLNKDKRSGIVIIAEGSKKSSYSIYKYIQKKYPAYDVRLTILGHIQRGGAPTAFDRVTASRMGVSAVEALKDNLNNIMVGLENNNIVFFPINRAIKKEKKLNESLLEILDILSI